MIEIRNLSKTFQTANGEVAALKNINLKINDGDIYGIIGMSGAGKSTLVRCINMLERPTEGEVFVNGVDLGSLSEKQLRAERKKITMIFQSFNLLMQKNCLKNICFPLEISKESKETAEKKARALLKTVGLPDKEKAYPAQLSGGQMQRIAIARALATNPDVLLCDEATSALDPKTTHQILELLRNINKKLGITVIIITHQMSVVEEICNRVAILDNGTVVEEGLVSDIFSNPKSEAAKRLVFPEGASNITKGNDKSELVMRVVFNGGTAAGSPLISQMAIDKNIAANILAASTKTLDGRVYGNMLLGIPGGRENFKTAMEYLGEVPFVTVMEVTENV